jgi:tetratricopeptide (TPR) repeat protein
MFLTLLFLFLTFPIQSTSESLNRARSALDQRDFPTAQRLIFEAIQSDPSNAEAHYLKGILFSEAGNLQEAKTAFEESLRLHPGLSLAYIGLSDVHRKLGKPEDSIRVLQEGLKIIPRDPLLHYQMGIELARNNQFEESLRFLTGIPEYQLPPGYWETLGRTYLSAGNFEESEKAMMKVLGERPKSVEILQTLYAIAMKMGDAEKAWDYIVRARELAPNSPKVVYAFAVASMQNHLVAEAVTALRLLLLREPDNPDYLFMLGNTVLESATEFSKSSDYFARYVELRPDEAQGHLMLGYSLFSNRRYSEAKASLQKALELDPSMIEPVYYLGMIAFNENQDEMAVEHLLRVLEDSDQHAKAHLALGKIYLRQGNFNEAIEELREAADLTGGNSDIHFNLSRAFAQLGDQASAKEQLDLYQKFKKEEEERELESRRFKSLERKQ